MLSTEAMSVPYSLYVVFETQCQIQDMEVDVQTTEAVLLLHKATASQGEWSGFKAGASLEDLEVIINAGCLCTRTLMDS